MRKALGVDHRHRETEGGSPALPVDDGTCAAEACDLAFTKRDRVAEETDSTVAGNLMFASPTSDEMLKVQSGPGSRRCPA